MQQGKSKFTSSPFLPYGEGYAGSVSPRAEARFSSQRPDYERYELEKLAFIRYNPNTTPRQYEAAMKAIAKRCGV